MQLHPGVLRNHHEATACGVRNGHRPRHPGRDGVHPLAATAPARLRHATRTFRLVLFTVDESTWSRELAPLAGFYPSVYVGAPWWFLDTPDGMRRFRAVGDGHGGLLQDVGLHRRHPRVLLDPRAARHRPADRRRPPRGPCRHARADRGRSARDGRAGHGPLAARRVPARMTALRRTAMRRRRSGRCTSGSAASSAPIRPGTPTGSGTTGGSRRSPGGPLSWRTCSAAQDGLYTLVTRGPDGDAHDVIRSLVDVHAARRARRLARRRRIAGRLAPHDHGHRGRLSAGERRRPRPRRRRRPRRCRRAASRPARAGRHGPGAARRGLRRPTACRRWTDHPGPVRQPAEQRRRPFRGWWPSSLISWTRPWPSGSEPPSRMSRASSTGSRHARRRRTYAALAARPASRTQPRSSPSRSASGCWPDGCPACTGTGRTSASGSPTTSRTFEHRKLWLLNGGHSLLAYVGSLRGATTVAEAVADDATRSLLELWWSEASRQLALPDVEVADYRAALTGRFANRRIHHRLDQIAADGSQKLPVRILPTLRAERAAGRLPEGAVAALAGWLCHLRGHGVRADDPHLAELRSLASGAIAAAAPRVLSWLDPALGADDALVDAVVTLADRLVLEAPR